MENVDSQYLIDNLPESVDDIIDILRGNASYGSLWYKLYKELNKISYGTRGYYPYYNKQYRKKNFPVLNNAIYNTVKLYSVATGSIVYLVITDFIDNYPELGRYNREKDIRLQIVRCSKENLGIPITDHEIIMTNYFKNITKDDNLQLAYRELTSNNEEKIFTIYTTKVTQTLLDEFIKTIPTMTRQVEQPNLYEAVKHIFAKTEGYKEMFVEYLKRAFNPEEQIITVIKKKKEREIELVNNNINNIKQSINNYIENINDATERLNNQERIKKSLTFELNETVDLSKYKEALEYLKKNFQGITQATLTTDTSNLWFDVKGVGPLIYFDDEAATRIHARYEEDLEHERYYNITREKADLFKMLFIDKTIKVNVYYNYKLLTDRCAPLTGERMSIENAIMHPHLMRYSCWGAHTAALAKYSAQQDYIGALTHCQYATIQIDVLDTCVIRWLLDEITTNTTKCIIDENGEYRNWSEYYETIKANRTDATDNSAEANEQPAD